MSNELNLTDLTTEATISQIISADQKAGEMLESIGLNTQNHKEESLTSVCWQKKWSEDEVLHWLKKNLQTHNGQSRNEAYPGENLTQWCEYIEENYHTPVLSLLEEINNDYPRIYKVHGHQYPWLKNAKSYLQSFDNKLQYYIYFERKTFFPLLKTLHAEDQQIMDGNIQQIKKGIEVLKSDQKTLLDLLNDIESKGDHFTNPATACTSFRILTSNLKQSFSILKRQIELERERVFPLINNQLASI